jgi:hypothetical protein
MKAGFTLQGHTYYAGKPCPAASDDAAEVSGEFSAEGDRLAATDVQAFRLPSGEQVVRRRSWAASRR